MYYSADLAHTSLSVEGTLLRNKSNSDFLWPVDLGLRTAKTFVESISHKNNLGHVTAGNRIS